MIPPIAGHIIAYIDPCLFKAEPVTKGKPPVDLSLGAASWAECLGGLGGLEDAGDDAAGEFEGGRNGSL